MSKVLIGIAILHYGKNEILTDLLRSLGIKEELKNLINRVYVLNENFVVYIHNDTEGKGFTYSANSAIEVLYDYGCNWIWLLNNDTEVEPNTLKIMPEVLSNLEDNIGIVGFMIRLFDQCDIIHHGGTLQCYPNGIHKSGSFKLGDLNKRTYERWVTFASVLIKRDVIRYAGFMDYNLKMIYSDSDYCYRARMLGYKVIYEPRFIIFHKVGISGKEPEGEMKSIFLSDALYFQNKWLNGKLFFDLDKEIF